MSHSVWNVVIAQYSRSYIEQLLYVHVCMDSMFACAAEVRMMSRSGYSLLLNLEYLVPDIAILVRVSYFRAGAPLT